MALTPDSSRGVSLGSANTWTANQTAPALAASGLTGATAASRYVGATASGAPGSGTFVIGDFVIDQTGKVYVCTVAGSPGTWVAAGAAGGVTELAYASITAAATITATSGGTPDTIVSTAQTSYAGTAIRLDFYAAAVFVPAGTVVQLAIWDTTSTRLGNIAAIGDGTIAPGAVPVFASVFVTPSAGNHTYMVRGHKQIGSGTSSVQAGSGASGTYQPAFIRATSGG